MSAKVRTECPKSQEYAFDIQFLNYEVREILSQDVEEVVKSKAISAYKRWRLPVVVEHGSLKIQYFNGFPGALSKPMWDLTNGKSVKPYQMEIQEKQVVISCVGFCDGKILRMFTGVTKGVISTDSRGSYGFFNLIQSSSLKGLKKLMQKCN